MCVVRGGGEEAECSKKIRLNHRKSLASLNWKMRSFAEVKSRRCQTYVIILRVRPKQNTRTHTLTHALRKKKNTHALRKKKKTFDSGGPGSTCSSDLL